MAVKLNLIVLLLVILAAGSSCTKEETTRVEYELISIVGKWHLTSWYDVQLQTIQNYPAILDSTIVTFSDSGRVYAQGSCSEGSGYYIQSQTKELFVYEFLYPNFLCGNTLQDETQANLFLAISGTYSFTLNGDELSLRTRKNLLRTLYLRKLE